MCDSNYACWGNGQCNKMFDNKKHCFDGGDCDYKYEKMSKCGNNEGNNEENKLLKMSINSTEC